MKYENKLNSRLFYLNIYNFFIFQYFYLKSLMDTLETMLLKIKIYIMVL